MGMRKTGFDIHDHAHPNNGGCYIFVGVSSPTFFLGATALNTLTAGQILTPTFFVMPGSGQSAKLTPSAAITLTLEIVGVDHLGFSRTERIVFTASAAAQFTKVAWRRIVFIRVISVTSAADTISIGIDPIQGNRIGLPVKVAPFAMAAPSATPVGPIEAIIDSLGLPQSIGADAAGDPAYNSEFCSVKLDGPHNPGIMLVLFKIASRAPRS